MTLAKPLAGGLPIGAVLMKQHVADVMKPGEQSTTTTHAKLCGYGVLHRLEQASIIEYTV
jgi:acetylornithine/succinyldiaminopimelate/putrescine aminotransferase